MLNTSSKKQHCTESETNYYFLNIDDQSDDDSSASVAEPADLPEKEAVHPEQCQTKSSRKSQLSPCHYVPTRISSPLKCPDFSDEEDEEVNTQKKPRMSSVRKKLAEERKSKSAGLSESLCGERRSDSGKNMNKGKRRSQIKLPHKSEKGKQKAGAGKSLTETKTHFFPDTVNSSCCLSSPAKLDEVKIELSKETSAQLQKMDQRTPKAGRPSLSSLVQSFTLSADSKSAALSSADANDDVFEDYFSSANCCQRSERRILPPLPVERDIHIPFELDSVSKKRKQRRSEVTGSESSSKKKVEESKTGKSHNQQSDAGTEPQNRSIQDVKESLGRANANVTFVAKMRQQSTIPFTSTSVTREAVKQRRSTSSEQLKNSNVIVLSHSLESE